MWDDLPGRSFRELPESSKRATVCLSALIAAEKNNLILAFEPESENIVNSATRARKLLNELRHPRLRIVIDPANLISQGCNQKEVLDEAFALLGDSIVLAHAKDREQCLSGVRCREGRS
jgi:sugar phosphate isomerase/epimerase